MKLSTKSLLAAMLSTALLTSAPQVLAKDNTNTGTLTVTGYGEYKVSPDLATLSFEVSAYEKDAKTAREAVEKTVTSFTKALEKLKLGDKAITAQSLNVSPRYETNKDGKVERIMYQASRMVTVKLDNFELIADVTDVAFASGINEVGHFCYELKDPKAAQKEARLKAIADAKEKALELAQGFNVKLGMPINLSYENQGHVIMPRTMMLKATALNSTGAAPESVYMVDDLTINAQVYATYKIEEVKEQKD